MIRVRNAECGVRNLEGSLTDERARRVGGSEELQIDHV